MASNQTKANNGSGDGTLLKFRGAASTAHPVPQSNERGNVAPSQVCFNRQELNLLLRLYGFRVARGEWRDYAIDMLRERAVFSVFRATSENPLFMIEKNPKLARRQGAYSVVNASGHVLKRGHDLAQVLKFFDKKPKLAAV